MTTEPPLAYLIKGDDPALVGQRLTALLDTLVGDDDPGLVIEDAGSADECDMAAVVDACATPPFLSARRVVVLRDVGRLREEDAARLVEYLGDALPTTTLVLVAGGGRLSIKLANAVKKAGEVIDTAVPSGKGRRKWLVDHLHDAPVRFDAAAGALIEEHLGDDLGRLAGLVDAVTAAFGPGASVGADDVADYLGQAGDVAPWELTDAIDRGDAAGALTALHRMLDAGDRHPLVVMASLHRHVAAMLRLDGADVRTRDEAAALLGISPFPADKALRQGRRLGTDGVSRAVRLLAQADLDLRGASAWPDRLVLEVLVARLARLVPRRSSTSASASAAGTRR